MGTTQMGGRGMRKCALPNKVALVPNPLHRSIRTGFGPADLTDDDDDDDGGWMAGWGYAYASRRKTKRGKKPGGATLPDNDLCYIPLFFFSALCSRYNCI